MGADVPPRPTRVYEADAGVRALANTGRLYIKDEGSEASLLYGNKIRKYSIPAPQPRLLRCEEGIHARRHRKQSLRLSRPGGTIRRLRARGRSDRIASGSHALSAGDHAGCRDQAQAAGGERRKPALPRWRRLGRALDSRGGIEGLGQRRAHRGLCPAGRLVAIDGAGTRGCAHGACRADRRRHRPVVRPAGLHLRSPGSGATAMGLVLGCHLLGWPTKVVGTCSQDKGRIVRLLANRDAETPFLVKNAELLLEKALKWTNALGLASGAGTSASARDMLRGARASGTRGRSRPRRPGRPCLRSPRAGSRWSSSPIGRGHSGSMSSSGRTGAPSAATSTTIVRDATTRRRVRS